MVKYKLLVLFVFFITPFCPNLLIATNTPPLSADQQIAEQIYQKLQQTIGDKRRDWPKLQVWGVVDRVASFVPNENTIYLDQKAIDICKTFNGQFEAALAFIIGHELTHFYQAHDWKVSGFVTHFMVAKEDFQEHLEHERQADVYGAFIAQQAGFQTIRIVPNLLNSIYKEYQLSSQADSKYPSLVDRQALAQEACHIAADLVEVYHTANYAMVLGKYEVAYQLYDFVGQSLQFKELYFNMAMSNLLQYYFWNTDLQLAYNFEIDPSIPLTRTDQMRHPSILLAEAERFFQKILQDFDANYFPAHLQLLTVYDWQNKTSNMNQQIAWLKTYCPPQQQKHLLLAIGNYYARQGQVNLAQEQYQSILQSSQPNTVEQLAKANSQFLQTGQSNKQKPSTRPSLRIEKGIDEIPSLTFYKNFPRNISIKTAIQLATNEHRNSYISKLNYQDQLLKLQRVYSPSITSNKGIRIGSTKAELERAYPQSQLGIVRHTEGYYIVNYEKGLIFKCNQQGIVEEWSLFVL